MDIDLARRHWKILQKMEKNFTDHIREFMVINKGEGVLMVTKPGGQLFWYGKMQFGTKTKKTTKPTRLDPWDVVKMAQGANHFVIVEDLRGMSTLGLNNCGQLANNYLINKVDPSLVHNIRNYSSYIDVRCGLGHNLVLDKDSRVFGWGLNDFGQIGVSSDQIFITSLKRVLQLGTHQVVAIECGGWHSLALTDQGQVYGWGCNRYGQLAQSDLSLQPTPKRMETASAVTQIAAGCCHTLLLTKEGLVFACGLNYCGQLGQPTSIENSSRLFQVSGLPRIAKIASHFNTELSIALSTDRRCYVWGKWNNSKCPIPLQLSSIYSTIESPFSCTESGCQETPHSIRLKVLQFSQLNLTTGSLVDSLLTSNFALLRQLGQMFDNPNFRSDLKNTLDQLNFYHISDDNRGQCRESTREHHTTSQHNPSNSQISIIHNRSYPTAIVFSLLRKIYSTTQN